MRKSQLFIFVFYSDSEMVENFVKLHDNVNDQLTK